MSFTTPRWLRRGAGAALALTAAATALSVTSTPADAGPPAASCSVDVSPATIHPGQSATFTLTGDLPEGYEYAFLTDGHIPPGYTGSHTANPYVTGFSYESFTSAGAISTGGFRVYDGFPETLTDSTEFLCEGVVALDPSESENPGPAPECSAEFGSDTVGPFQSVHLVLDGDAGNNYQLQLIPNQDEPIGWNDPQTIPDDLEFTYGGLAGLGENVSTVTALVFERGADIEPENVLCSDTVTLVTAKDPQTITFAPVATHNLEWFLVTASTTSDLSVEFTSETPDVCDVTSSGGVTPLSAGTCTIVASQGGDADYEPAADVTRDITITPWSQEITFSALADVRLDQGPIALHASSSMDLVVDFDSETPSVCTVEDGKAVLHAAGTCTIVASQDGAEGTIEAASATRSFQVLSLPVVPTPDVSTPVAPAPVTPAPVLPQAKLVLTAPAGLPLSAGTGAVKTSSDGTGAVTVASTTAEVCRVTGTGTVKLLKAGTCGLSATQGADAGHQAPDAATASFPVWGFPSLPAKARSTQVLPVLGKGEASYKVVATPAEVCRATDGDVALIDGGVCRIEVRSGGDVVRTAKVKVTVPAKPASPKHSMDIGATVYFGFNSARLTAEGKATLRKVAPMLRKADLVVVYGHTYGPGKNSPASRALAAKRARASVAFLDGLGVKSKVVSEVAMAMQQPVSDTAWKNRRAEVYYR